MLSFTKYICCVGSHCRPKACSSCWHTYRGRYVYGRVVSTKAVTLFSILKRVVIGARAFARVIAPIPIIMLLSLDWRLEVRLGPKAVRATSYPPSVRLPKTGGCSVVPLDNPCCAEMTACTHDKRHLRYSHRRYWGSFSG